jgi:hypothetical protein
MEVTFEETFTEAWEKQQLSVKEAVLSKHPTCVRSTEVLF